MRITLKDFAPLTPPIDSANIRDFSAGGQGQDLLPKRVKLLESLPNFHQQRIFTAKKGQHAEHGVQIKLETNLYWVVALHHYHSNINFTLLI